MRGLCHRLAAGLLLLSVAGGEASAQIETPAKPSVVRELQRALREDDRAWLADRVRYPLRYHGRTIAVIRNRTDFLRNYDRFVSDRLRAAILIQDPDRVFENWQGMMVGDGTHNMWLRESGDGEKIRYEIVTINDSP